MILIPIEVTTVLINPPLIFRFGPHWDSNLEPLKSPPYQLPGL